MKTKAYLLFLLVLVIASCQKKVHTDELDKLNGYWEIVSAKTPDGEEKEFSANTNVDYIVYKNGAGFRQKMIPQLDGTFKSNGLKEEIQLKESGNQSIFLCKTEFANWEEEITALDEEHFEMINEQGIIYQYKKFEPIRIKP